MLAVHSASTYSTPAPHFFEDDARIFLAEIAEEFFQEVENCLALVAATGSIANALEADMPGMTANALASFLPPPLRLYGHIAPRLSHTGLSSDLRFCLRRFSDALNLSRDLTICYVAADRHAAEVVAFDMSGVAIAWQSVACTGRDALQLLQEELAPYGQFQPSLELTARLDAVANGETPCLLETGEVDVATVFNRRANARRSLRLQAFVMHNGMIQRVLICDVSRFGLSVRDLDGSIGDPVLLLVGPGKHLPGTVVWQSEDGVGIQLSAPLPDSFGVPFAV